MMLYGKYHTFKLENLATKPTENTTGKSGFAGVLYNLSLISTKWENNSKLLFTPHTMDG